ncbi:MAG: hypothetical protein ACD_80C00127G0002 [uncultured bacterium (gcode 4)]|uniref:Uncharacterized protein n=1 Tax=uncultured bacterium (gcode 4) TaxID=1234023 RepID=K1X4K1_9BACT|nr:MAG: hypothetical protein ACD_80C00127G0002 [uncultured bacterium (gcode 4)]HBB04174.1 hypothetical protein [Candidatus Gracilibacteria bacterium]
MEPTTHKYIQFKFLGGTTETRKVQKRYHPPLVKPQNTKAYRYFDLENDMLPHLANVVEEKDMINPTAWETCQITEPVRP